MEVDQATTSSSIPSSNPDGTSTQELEKDSQGNFLQTGRVGRRNAVPDIQSDASSHVSTADLPLELQKLSCSG